MRNFLQDLRYGLRALLKSPGFSTVAILTLALGIGATTAMFTVADGILLKPLRYRDPDRIVQIQTYFTKPGRAIPRVTGGDYVDLQDQRQTFDSMGYYYGGELGIQVASRAEFVNTWFVSPGFMNVFGVVPLHGRTFNADDPERSAIVSAAFAARNFGNPSAADGQSITLENRTYTIVGVAPLGFHFPPKAEVWIASPAKPEFANRTSYNYRTVARLRDGVSLDAANARLAALGSQLGAAFPVSNGQKTFTAVALRDQLVSGVRTTLYFLMGAVGLVLLIACANVANLLLARATARSREMAVRAALGATRWQIVRQLLAESLALAVVAGAFGIAIAYISTNLLVLRGAAAVGLPRLDDVSTDWRVLLFAVGLCFVCSVGFGLAPAFQAARVNLQDALKQAGSRGVLGGQSVSLRSILVVAQIALSFVLVIGAGLLFRSFLSLVSVQLGFTTESTLVMYMDAPARTLDENLRVIDFENDLYDRIRQIPGVVSVAGAMGVPAGDYGSNGTYLLPGQDWNANHDQQHADFSLSSPGYFSTIGIPLLRGRDFTLADRYGSEPVVIVSEALARQSFASSDPIGQQLRCGLDELSAKPMTVIGIVGNVRQDSPSSPMAPAMYMPLAQHPYRSNEVEVVVRSRVAPASLIDPIQQIVRSRNPQAATRFTTMDEMISDSVAAPRFRMSLAIAFAVVALMLAIMGVYAVMSYVTAQRTGEFAVRAALGAPPAAILALVLRSAARLAVIGVIVGVALALAASRVLTTMLFGLKSTDAATYAVVFAVVVPAVLLAAALPARRASKVDPLVALRNE